MTRSGGARAVAIVVAGCLWLAACSPDPEADRVRKTTVPTYDKSTGKLTQLTYDRNHNGVVDTWTDMDGTTPLRSRIDLDEDGKIDRWEYYDRSGALTKVGFSRTHPGKPDAWAYAGADGRIERVETSSVADESRIDRWEHYDPASSVNAGEGTGTLLAVEEDDRGDGKPHKWEKYDHGVLVTADMDEDGDGKPDRRLTYRDGVLVAIESAPETSGRYTKRVEVPR
jgi:hypothetical protein